MKALSFGDIAVTTEEVGGPTGEIYSPAFSVIGFSVARQLSDRANFGLSVQLINESIRSQKASGVAFDLGFQYNSPWKGFKFGAVMKNFGPKMSYEGSDFGFTTNPPDADPSAAGRTVVTQSSSFDLPSSFQLGILYEPLRAESMSQLRLVSALQSNTFGQDQYRFGAEYGYREQLYLRGGFVTRQDDEDVWKGTFGGGVRFGMGQSHLLVDYTMQSVSEFFNDLNLVSVAFQF